MSDLYVISILGNLGVMLGLTGCFCLLVGGWIYGTVLHDASVYDTQEEKEAQRRCKKKANKLFIIGFISLLVICFIPSTKEMYAIYGIGGVIDYVKGNEKAKKLPDKVIDALDKYLDEQKGCEKRDNSTGENKDKVKYHYFDDDKDMDKLQKKTTEYIF